MWTHGECATLHKGSKLSLGSNEGPWGCKAATLLSVPLFCPFYLLLFLTLYLPYEMGGATIFIVLSLHTTLVDLK